MKLSCTAGCSASEPCHAPDRAAMVVLRDTAPRQAARQVKAVVRRRRRSVVEVAWVPGWYELDPPLEVGLTDEFAFWRVVPDHLRSGAIVCRYVRLTMLRGRYASLKIDFPLMNEGNGVSSLRGMVSVSTRKPWHPSFLHRMNTKYPEAWWFHWAMRDVTFGWPMLEHRMKMMLKEPLNISEEHLVDIHASLAKDFGREFIARPQLLQLAELNGLAHADLFTGPVEVEALERGDYLAVSRSTAKKAEIIGQVLVKYVAGELMTAGSKQRRRRRWSVIKQDALPRELIGAAEASRLCGVSRATWYRLLAGAKIPQPHKIGRRTLWDAKELRLWIDSSCPGWKRWAVERRLFGLGRKGSS